MIAQLFELRERKLQPITNFALSFSQQGTFWKRRVKEIRSGEIRRRAFLKFHNTGARPGGRLDQVVRHAKAAVVIEADFGNKQAGQVIAYFDPAKIDPFFVLHAATPLRSLVANKNSVRVVNPDRVKTIGTLKNF